MEEKFLYEIYDLDWFILSKDKKIIHFASGGGLVPEIIAKNLANMELLNQYFRGLPKVSDVIINPTLDVFLDGIKLSAGKKGYLKDYIFMAERGITSFTKTLTVNANNSAYHLVATPLNFLNFENLPSEFKEIMLIFKTELDFSQINLIDKHITSPFLVWEEV